MRRVALSWQQRYLELATASIQARSMLEADSLWSHDIIGWEG